jgi:hypothetical protein
VYNFDECGFRPSEGESWRVVRSKKNVPNLPKAKKGENITAIECITTNGWQIEPLFIFKGGGAIIEN